MSVWGKISKPFMLSFVFWEIGRKVGFYVVMWEAFWSLTFVFYFFPLYRMIISETGIPTSLLIKVKDAVSYCAFRGKCGLIFPYLHTELAVIKRPVSCLILLIWGPKMTIEIILLVWLFVWDCLRQIVKNELTSTIMGFFFFKQQQQEEQQKRKMLITMTWWVVGLHPVILLVEQTPCNCCVIDMSHKHWNFVSRNMLIPGGFQGHLLNNFFMISKWKLVSESAQWPLGCKHGPQRALSTDTSKHEASLLMALVNHHHCPPVSYLRHNEDLPVNHGPVSIVHMWLLLA